MKLRNWIYQLEAGSDGGDSGGGAATTEAPAATTAAPAATTAQATTAAPTESTAAPAASTTTTPAAKTGDAPASKEETVGTWPANWRETVSKGDAKKLERMGRYASPEAVADALFAAQERISKGELKPALNKNATPEEKAVWREAHGIPATPDKYDLGQDTKLDPNMSSILLQAAHESDQTPDQVKATLGAWNKMTKLVSADRAEKDVNLQVTSEDELRSEWGPEFRRNINLAHSLLDGASTPDLKAKFLEGRLSDGTPIGSSPEVLKMLVNLALIQNPSGVVVPGSEANPMQGVEDEMTKIENTMKTNRKAYDKDEKLQARYRDLIDAKEKLKPRK